MRRSRRYLAAFIVATLLLAALAPLSHRIGAELPSDATPTAEPSSGATDLTSDQVDDIPTDVPTDTPAPVETEIPPTDAPIQQATDVPTDEPTLPSTDPPAAQPTDTAIAPTEAAGGESPTAQPTGTAEPGGDGASAPATKAPTVKAQDVDTGSLHIQVVDADGNALPETCVSYGSTAQHTTAFTTVCDGATDPSISSLNDAVADGYVDVSGVPAGTWQLKGSDVAGSFSVAPLPVFVEVLVGQTTSATIYAHRAGILAVQLRGDAGQPTTGCAEIDSDWGGAGGTGSGPFYNRFARTCDGDDGTVDGVAHFANVPAGSFWVWGFLDSQHIGVDFDFERASVADGQTTTVAIYSPSSRVTVVLKDADTGETITTVQPRVKKVFDDGAETVDNLLVGPGTYYVFTDRTWIDDDYGRSLFIYQANYTDSFTLGVGDSITVTLTLSREQIPTPTPSPTESPSPTPTATATATPIVGHPQCWAELVDNPNRTYKLDCDDYVPGETVTVYWDHTNTKPIASFTANGKGSGTVWVSIAQATGGQHLVVWQGSQSTKKITRPVTVQQTIHLSVDRGVAGTIVTINASGFGRNEQVTVYWDPYLRDGQALKTVTSRRNGAVVTKIKVPKGEPNVANEIALVAPSGHEADTVFVLTEPKRGKSAVAKVKSEASSVISAIDLPTHLPGF